MRNSEIPNPNSISYSRTRQSSTSNYRELGDPEPELGLAEFLPNSTFPNSSSVPNSHEFHPELDRVPRLEFSRVPPRTQIPELEFPKMEFPPELG